MSRLFWQLCYRCLLLPVGLALLGLAARRNEKLRRTLEGRQGLWRRLEAQLAERDPARPLVWFHVASAGELLQALPVLERFLAEGAQGALTVTSVSGYRWAQRLRDDLPGLLLADYLPVDRRHEMRELIGLLRPAVLVYTKYDLWPNLVWEAERAGVPQFLISATLQERSLRLRWPLRSLYRTLYTALDGIFAVSEDDRARFAAAVPGHPGLAVLGDTRFDSVLARRDALAPPALPSALCEGTVLVVGSSWPPDEARVFPGLREALVRYPALRVLLVPHEIHEAHLREIEAAFGELPLARFTRLDAGHREHLRVLVVDTVGVLAALYAYASLAYVGGAFTTGVHNVLEPAAMGVPPVFGPFYQNSPEAVELVAQGLAFTIREADEFRALLFALLDDPHHLGSLGRGARDYVQRRAGAAARAHARIAGRLPPAPRGEG